MTEDEAVRAEHPAAAVGRWQAADPDCVLLDGFHALKHALRFGADVRVAVTTDRQGLLRLAAELAPDLGAELAERVAEVPGPVLRDLVPRVHPTGVAALAVRRDPEANLAALHRMPRLAPLVVLDGPRNLGNVGAVVRLAAGFAATGVVTTGDLDPWHPNAVRSGAGLHYATAVERADPAALPPGPRYVLDPEGADIRDTGLPDDALVVFGSERHGVSAELRAGADELVSLPMRAQVSSYNLATSVGMALYHWAATSRSPLVPGRGGPPAA
ncbi:putative rRNA methyltransferase [Actinacidiphila reveromycinica]|uniref:Putative rRNA methyltransferase n=1 Tax=Actinacidiphila reveromycinica TaxID=659352 RepID=A0A7U3UU45_9ACTN|nr:TrmH family RNA methyltransferase [Streptomyces sp. SN-593]BBA98771.1 putative rRNA methyltransferase [Streptomyces sp. SN-593]